MAKMQDYKCVDCNVWWTAEWVDSDELAMNTPHCPECNWPNGVRKKFSFSVTKPMREFTSVTGQPVSSMRQLKNQLRAASDDAEMRTGVPHDFQPIDLRDRDALGVTDEGLDSTYRNLHNEGRLKAKFIST